jgi:hypothetical protein
VNGQVLEGHGDVLLLLHQLSNALGSDSNGLRRRQIGASTSWGAVVVIVVVFGFGFGFVVVFKKFLRHRTGGRTGSIKVLATAVDCGL